VGAAGIGLSLLVIPAGRVIGTGMGVFGISVVEHAFKKTRKLDKFSKETFGRGHSDLKKGI
jgi:hypothetical protein